jgi:hypothetical protein
VINLRLNLKLLQNIYKVCWLLDNLCIVFVVFVNPKHRLTEISRLACTEIFITQISGLSKVASTSIPQITTMHCCLGNLEPYNTDPRVLRTILGQINPSISQRKLLLEYIIITYCSVQFRTKKLCSSTEWWIFVRYLQRGLFCRWLGLPDNLDQTSLYRVSMTEGLLYKDIRKIFRHVNKWRFDYFQINFSK